MKKFIALAMLSFFALQIKAQTDNSTYDKALADSLGSDEFGMKMYVLAILKTGTVKIDDKTLLDSIFKGHMSNMGRLVTEKKLLVAGPLGKNENNYRGIFILNVSTVEEARKLVDTDPAIKSKLMDVDLYPWYGSAALPAYLKVHDKIQKKKMM